MNQLLRRGLFLVMAGAILMTGCQSKNGDQASKILRQKAMEAP